MRIRVAAPVVACAIRLFADDTFGRILSDTEWTPFGVRAAALR